MAADGKMLNELFECMSGRMFQPEQLGALLVQRQGELAGFEIAHRVARSARAGRHVQSALDCAAQLPLFAFSGLILARRVGQVLGLDNPATALLASWNFALRYPIPHLPDGLAKPGSSFL
ncbi:MAG: hypothetical protein MJE77_17525 [Proteobacteria bacterium]|nr:hypothetical protein [Pseudomonadota bacterium]